MPEVFLSIFLSGPFLGIGPLVFSKFWKGVKNPYEVVLARARFFPKKNILVPWGKCAQNGPKIGFCEFI